MNVFDTLSTYNSRLKPERSGNAMWNDLDPTIVTDDRIGFFTMKESRTKWHRRPMARQCSSGEVRNVLFDSGARNFSGGAALLWRSTAAGKRECRVHAAVARDFAGVSGPYLGVA